MYTCTPEGGTGSHETTVVDSTTCRAVRMLGIELGFSRTVLTTEPSLQTLLTFFFFLYLFLLKTFLV